MEPEQDPEIIYSKHNKRVSGVGDDPRQVEVYIYTTEGEPGWILEVVNDQNTSWVWDQVFDTDDAAYNAFNTALKEEGMDVFFGEE